LVWNLRSKLKANHQTHELKPKEFFTGAGAGADGYRANVRSAIKRIRNKLRSFDPTFDEIENYNGFRYCWKKSG
jgi:hypothetical protein